MISGVRKSEASAWCRECGAPLASPRAMDRGTCGPCARRRSHVVKTDELDDGFVAPEPWDGWDP